MLVSLEHYFGPVNLLVSTIAGIIVFLEVVNGGTLLTFVSILCDPFYLKIVSSFKEKRVYGIVNILFFLL